MASESLNVVDFKEIAVLAAAFRELFAAVRGPAKTNSMFRSLFETLEATCEEINPVLHDMEMFNMILDRPPNELKRIHDLMEKGKKLVTKFSKVRWFAFYHKCCYAKELVKLDKEMKSFFLINVAAITARNAMEVAVDVKEIRDNMRMITGSVNIGVGGGCYEKKDGPEAPSFVVGVDKQYQEVNSRLLQKGVSVTVVSGPGGCGRTTLVNKIYHDPEIKG